LRNQIYVADPTGNQVVVIDGATNRTTYLPGTSTDLWRIAVNPLTNEVYAANLEGSSATIYAAAPAPLPCSCWSSCTIRSVRESRRVDSRHEQGARAGFVFARTGKSRRFSGRQRAWHWQRTWPEISAILAIAGASCCSCNNCHTPTQCVSIWEPFRGSSLLISVRTSFSESES